MIPAQCLFFTGIGQVGTGDTELPDPGPDDIVVTTILSSISPGTELRCLAGDQDGLGRDSFPFIPGYSLVGRVTQATGRHAALLGKTVFCAGARQARHRAAWGGHISHAVVPGDAVVVVPEGIRAEDAVLAKLAAISHRGVLLAKPQHEEAVVVVGLGPIGQLSARLFAQAGARVLGLDLSAERVAIAQRAGIQALVPSDGLDATVRRVLPRGAPIVVDATGARRLLPETMNLLRDKPWDDSAVGPARLVVQGSYPGDVTVPSTTAFVKEMMMLWPRDSERSDMERILALLARREISFDGLLAGVFAPAEAQAVYDRLRAAQAGFLTAAFRW